MVRLVGVEPTTTWFVARYSIQLSYKRTLYHSANLIFFNIKVAEREGFEPSKGSLLYTLSRGALSATQPPLLNTAKIIPCLFLLHSLNVKIIRFYS
jgi:hypothetical protein